MHQNRACIVYLFEFITFTRCNLTIYVVFPLKCTISIQKVKKYVSSQIGRNYVRERQWIDVEYMLTNILQQNLLSTSYKMQSCHKVVLTLAKKSF